MSGIYWQFKYREVKAHLDKAQELLRASTTEVAQLREALIEADGSHIHADDCHLRKCSGCSQHDPCDCGQDEEKATKIRAALATPSRAAEWLTEHNAEVRADERAKCDAAWSEAHTERIQHETFEKAAQYVEGRLADCRDGNIDGSETAKELRAIALMVKR